MPQATAQRFHVAIEISAAACGGSGRPAEEMPHRPAVAIAENMDSVNLAPVMGEAGHKFFRIQSVQLVFGFHSAMYKLKPAWNICRRDKILSIFWVSTMRT